MIATLLPLLVFDFALQDHGLVGGGIPTQWEHGVPTVGPPTTSTVWGTQLDRNYLNDAEATLDLPLPDSADLAAAARPVLVLDHWFDAFPGDGGVVEIDTGAGYVVAEPLYGYPAADGFSGTSDGFERHAFDLSGLDPVAVRLVFRSDAVQASAGWYLQQVAWMDGDPVPPRIQPVVLPSDNQEVGEPQLVQLEVEDDVGVDGVSLFVQYDGGPPQEVVATSTGSTYDAWLPEAGVDTVVSWYAIATDGQNTARYPTVGTESFRVFLAAPTGLRADLEPHAVATEVTLRWDAPQSPHEPVEYVVRHTGRAAPLTTTRRTLDVALRPDDTLEFSVAARYDEGEGDVSDPITLALDVPDLTTLEPSLVFPGDRRWLRIEGDRLYLLDGVSTLDLGPDVVVESLEVLDVQRASALVLVREDAAPGVRALHIEGTQGELTFRGRFEVGGSDAAPRITKVSPSHITQGATELVRVQASEDFGPGPYSLDVGDKLVVLGTPEVDGATLQVELGALASTARGDYTVAIDDGQRLWTFDLTVDRYRASVQRTCSVAPGPGGSLLLLLTVAATGRRRRPDGRSSPRPRGAGAR